MPELPSRAHALVETFHQLHASGCFVIPNPFNVGTARILEQLGFKALATTSSGFAWSQGKADNQVSLPDVLNHLHTISNSVAIPVNADFEGGFATEPADLFANVSQACVTGISGLSIEDSSGDDANPLFEFELSVERIKAARAAIDQSGGRILLTGRSEGFVANRPDLGETIRRLVAYADAGADCLFAPGIRNKAEVVAVVNAVAPKPVNVLVYSDFFTVQELADVGVRRISVGGALARAAMTAFVSAATEIAERGSFTQVGSVPRLDFNGMFT